MLPNCVKCGAPTRLMWSLSRLEGDKWITKERYNCESCGRMQDAELPEPLWKIWTGNVSLSSAKIPCHKSSA